MTPIGKYIKISKPERVNNYHIITEQERISKAKVCTLSPDISVPFFENSSVFIPTGSHISTKYGFFVPLDAIVGYSL